MRRSKWLAALIVIGCCSVAAVTSASPARAVNWAGKSKGTGCNALNQADNRAHSVYRYDLGAEYSDAVAWQVATILEPTVVDPSLVSSFDDLTDVIVHDFAYETYCGFTWFPNDGGAGVIGLVTCPSVYTPQGDCEQHKMYLSTTWASSSSGTTTQVRRLVSHEMGHTLGLAHRSSTTTAGVMEPSAPWETANYTANHDLAHLDSLD